MIYITYNIKTKKVVRCDSNRIILEENENDLDIIEKNDIDIMDDFLLNPLKLDDNNNLIIDEEINVENLKKTKIKEMNDKQQVAINNGIDISLSDGTIDHFDLSANDQVSLMGLQAVIASGQEFIPWHTSDNTQHCKFYKASDMQKIITMATNYVAYHITYFRDLRIYINHLTTKEELNAVEYGMTIPEEFQSEPLKMLLAAINKVANDD